MSRKAGSNEFKKELSRAQRNEQIRTEIGQDPERLSARISVVDRDKYDVSGYSDQDINKALQGSKFDENDYARLTGKTLGDGNDNEETTTTNPPPTTNTPQYGGGGSTQGNNSPVQSGSTQGDYSPVQNQNTTGGSSVAVGGNNNGNIDASVDNSKYYGGSSRTFNFTPSKGKNGNPDGLYDSPVSKATMGGFYDVDDSPAATQKFLDFYIDNNIGRARESEAYSNATAPDPRKLAERSRAFNPVAMQERLDREPLIDRDRSTVQMGNIFGDMYRWRENPINWVMPDAPNPITSEAGEIAKDYAKKIEEY